MCLDTFPKSANSRTMLDDPGVMATLKMRSAQ